MSVESNPMPQHDSTKNELFIITIEIDQGVEKNLSIYENDDPITVATDFCVANQLSTDFITTLADQIKLSLVQYSITKSKSSFNHDIKNDIIQEETSVHIDATEGEENITDTEDSHLASHIVSVPAEKQTQSIKYFAAIPKMEKAKDNKNIVKQNNSLIKISNIQIESSKKPEKKNSMLNQTVNLPKSKSVCRTTTFGDRLYQEALNLLERRSKHSQLSKKENEEKELIGVTLHPNINAVLL